ncbi:MAG: DHH family phosphoesterase [Rhodanobacteraceae bacterium]
MNGVRIERRPVFAKAPEWSAGLHPVLRRVYAARGVRAALEVEHRLQRLASPILGGLASACALLTEMIARDRRILVVGDFDCDGATATAVALRGLRLLGARHVDYRVPHRALHGYGLSPALVSTFSAPAPDLIVTVDNGIASHAGVAAARARGIRVLVTDHHLPGETLPDADAIVNPSLPFGETRGDEHFRGDSHAPDAAVNSPAALKSLCGVGVVFYLLLALRAHLSKPQVDLAALLDLVALGTVADLVPLDTNNRILVAAGLNRIRASRACAGICALFEAAGRDPARAVAADLGFAIGPRINAAGRIEDMSIGIECLLSDDPSRAAALAGQLSDINAERRSLQAAMIEQAEAAVEKVSGQTASASVGVVLYHADWHPGIVGLVASRLKERLNRPVVACAPVAAGSSELRGSARSIPGFHVRDALATVDAREPGLIGRFGGHAMAAGLSLLHADLERFAIAFDRVAQEQLGTQVLQSIVFTDGELHSGDFDLSLAQTLRYAGPWGQGFAEPLFDNVFDVEQWRLVGGKHWRLRLVPVLPATDSCVALDGMLFNATAGAIPPPRMRAAYQLEIDQWNGRERLRLVLRHFEPVATDGEETS